MQKRKNNLFCSRETKKVIENALKDYLKNLKGPRLIRKAMEYVVFSGGKRLRPLLTIESTKALRGNVKKTLPFACAIELIHNFSLVHDDLPCMDDDDTRRGKPTCHKKFGESVAMLTGDALLNLAFGILAKTNYKRTLEIISRVSDAVGVENMIGGQVLDLEKKERGSARFVKRLTHRKINAMKTASLMAVSCEAGALVAGAATRDVERMREFGKNLGLAFQIADDLEDAECSDFLLEREKKEAKDFIMKAKRHVAPFGKMANGLRYIADGILEKIDRSKGK